MAAAKAKADEEAAKKKKTQSTTRRKSEPMVFASSTPTGPSGRAMENGMAPTSTSSGSLGGLGGLFSKIFSGIGGTISKIGGGISSLGGVQKRAEGGEIDQESMGYSEMEAPEGLAALQSMSQTEQPEFDGNEKDLISQAISAIKGEIEDPRQILALFVSTYGEDALRNLVDKVEGGDVDATAQESQGQLRGPGDGMSDMIPANVGEGSDVLLSDGEYIVSADVVSGLGNGSSDAGAKQLDNMMARVREQRTGSQKQASQIKPEEAMPA